MHYFHSAINTYIKISYVNVTVDYLKHNFLKRTYSVIGLCRHVNKDRCYFMLTIMHYSSLALRNELTCV